MWNLVWLKHTLSETKNLVCKFFVDSTSEDIGMLNDSLIGGLFTNDFVCRFGRYMRGIAMEDLILNQIFHCNSTHVPGKATDEIICEQPG